MILSRRFAPALLALVLSLASACDGVLGPAEEIQAPESELTFVRVSSDAPPLETLTASFWIKRGETREVQIRYVTYNGNGKCLLFRVPAEAPLYHPDGRRFAVGDSALVTVRVVDAMEFRFEFDPSGLRFDPAHPAELEVRYRWADPDFNQDGVVDAEDERIRSRFGFWRQERAGEPYERIPTTRLEDVLEARAKVTGFTIYALASN